MAIKKIVILVFVLSLILLEVAFFSKKTALAPVSTNSKNIAIKNNLAENSTFQNQSKPKNQNLALFTPPLPDAKARVTRKPFGIFITPQNSPVQPERFRGYHTGTDFEIFSQELHTDVAINSICNGKLLLKKYFSGYGGVAIQSCALSDGSPITVIYGHLRLNSILPDTGEKINAGKILGLLGADKSSQTDQERKHLHLGIHKGNAINILGYVQNKSALSDWINPCSLICQ